jgi:hypothetical protein
MKEITYSQSGDYLIPNLELPQQEDVTIGKYGMLRHTYLKTYKRGFYAKLLLSGKLQIHLIEVDLQARKMVQKIMCQTSLERNLPDKESKQIEWVGAMNELKYEVEEIVLHQIIYK